MESELARWGSTGVSIFCLVIMFWIIKKVFNEFLPVVQELTVYLKKRNGSLEKNDKTIMKMMVESNKNITRVTEKVNQLCEINKEV